MTSKGNVTAYVNSCIQFFAITFNFRSTSALKVGFSFILCWLSVVFDEQTQHISSKNSGCLKNSTRKGFFCTSGCYTFMGMNTYSLNMKLPLMCLFFYLFIYLLHIKIYWLVKWILFVGTCCCLGVAHKVSKCIWLSKLMFFMIIAVLWVLL